ncbi:helix-turn-helix domain-containing protein [Kitasatospora aburaviensis]|uniref:Helix-turn-helix domain-containing protein n=1 Tax=Kitasatospora aburaviensis TaxID=67265 RepID=A0ABW1F4T1_9ACTN
MTGAPERPLRADAARNRAKLLDAATEVFTTRGIATPTEEIARAAGVGVGTLFRHFPTKEALLEAVMVRRLEEIATTTAQLAHDAERPDGAGPGGAGSGGAGSGGGDGGNSGEAFFAALRVVVDRSAGKDEFTRALAAAGVDAHAALHESGTAIREHLARLLAAAQRTGAVRHEVGMTELFALLVGTTTAVERLQDDPAARERVFTVVFDGLRPR